MALCGGIVLEEALDLSFDRLLMMMIMKWGKEGKQWIKGRENRSNKRQSIKRSKVVLVG